LGLHLYHDAKHPEINTTNQIHTQSPKLHWLQYKDPITWIVVTGLASVYFLLSANFTAYVLTKGKITMTDAFSVLGILKIRSILARHIGIDHPSAVWCFASTFYVTKRWKRWVCAIGLWYILCFFIYVFIMEFGVMRLYQYIIRQGPDCNDTDVWDCFTMFKSEPHYRRLSPIMKHNCFLVQSVDPLFVCRQVTSL
jgi:hypothetical protein